MRTLRRLGVTGLLVGCGFACGETTGPAEEPSTELATALAPQFAAVSTDTTSGSGGSGSSWRLVVLDSLGQAVDSIVGLPAQQAPVAWSPDGTRVAFDLSLLDAPEGRIKGANGP